MFFFPIGRIRVFLPVHIFLRRQLKVSSPLLSARICLIINLFSHIISTIVFSLFALALFSYSVDLMLLLLLLLSALLLGKVFCLLLNLQKRVISVALLLGTLAWGLLLSRDEAPRLIGFEKGVLPMLVFLLTKKGGLLDLEKSVPRDLLFYLDQEIVASLLARGELDCVNSNELLQHFLILTVHIAHMWHGLLTLKDPVH